MIIFCIFQLPTLTLLQADRSTLTSDQWNLLSNIVHCYDAHSKMLNAVEYLNEQNKLPAESRFEISSVHEFIMSLLTTAELLFVKSSNFSFVVLSRPMCLIGKFNATYYRLRCNFRFIQIGIG